MIVIKPEVNKMVLLEEQLQIHNNIKLFKNSLYELFVKIQLLSLLVN